MTISMVTQSTTKQSCRCRARWGVFAAALACAPGIITGASVAAPGADGFSFEDLRLRAREISAQPYHPASAPELPDFLKKLSYAESQAIRFRAEQSPWHGQPFRFDLQFVHRGGLFPDPVRIHLLARGQVHDFQFAPDQFDYGQNKFPQPVRPNLDFAGLRVLYRFDPREKPEEIASFLGASYFHLAAAHHRFGAAARGLALDTAEPAGEEFPKFTEFWIQTPQPRSQNLDLFALLDSASVAGAYHFILTPGETTTIDVEASLFFRKEVKKAGFAPLTSMFLMGKNRTRFIADYRPEVHDSDGLLLHASSGEWLWRPLVNPPRTHIVTDFPLDDLAGFGLVQRAHDFHDYEDLASRYDLRPSLWVQPLAKWGQGAVELVEIPSPSEGNDNIVAYWNPRAKLVPGQEFRCAYRLAASWGDPSRSPLLCVISTRITPEHDKIPPRFVIDFGGSPPLWLAANAPVAAKAHASRGEVKNLLTQKNAVTGGWRATFELEASGADPVEMRCWLRSEGQALSETWLYDFQNP